jgi:hypothetical protein
VQKLLRPALIDEYDKIDKNHKNYASGYPDIQPKKFKDFH